MLSIPPKYSISGFMGYLKGKNNLMIFQKFENMNHEDEDFTVDRTKKTVTWTSTTDNDGFDIDTDLTDFVRFEYEYKPANQ